MQCCRCSFLPDSITIILLWALVLLAQALWALAHIAEAGFVQIQPEDIKQIRNQCVLQIVTSSGFGVVFIDATAMELCSSRIISLEPEIPFVTSTFLSHRLLLSCLEAELIVLLFPPKFSRTRPATTPPCTFAKLLFKISLLHLLQACRYIPVEIFFVSETLHNLQRCLLCGL